ncbi:hypothetical protein NX722_21110 [Endozoicomonas gorgoniicola]|uniref:DUF4255 domain-containing protein n=1 Tax=Endozoicomonas gorgoniicola TaxID=1234144 RepID=A0ABT3N0E0_9GAMM|nr:hypothetical protein [Endozoicomonas gorgoniicola]MCW7555075.1 hypothetical protein [Endozoicomonas gorgoniicola]
MSYLGNLHPGVEIYHQSLAAGGGDLLNEPGIPIPVNTSVIHLSSRDETTLQWLRRTVRNTSSREDVIIIPGFIHEPTRVRVEVIPPDTARGDVFYTVNLWSPENPAFQRIRMNVVPVSDIHHSISALFIYIGEAELRVSVYNPESALPDYAPPNEAPPAYSQTNRPYTSDQDLQAGELPAPFARGGFEHAFQPSGSGGH